MGSAKAFARSRSDDGNVALPVLPHVDSYATFARKARRAPMRAEAVE